MRILVTGGSGFIGTNLIKKLSSMDGLEMLNLDVSKPKVESQICYWHKCDLLNVEELENAFASYLPEVVVHLAARTDTDPGNKLSDYNLNTQGSSNLLNAIAKTTTVRRIVITSTQFVHQFSGTPRGDDDFAPHTVYGESKVIMEKMVRGAELNCAWTIIRPTNIWGPWHLRYPFEFWKILSKGLYFHPGHEPVLRSYGYVGNVVAQIISIIESPIEKVDKKVFYVGDLAIDLYEWVNGFSRKQTGKDVKVVPRFIIKILAKIGDVMAFFKIKFPITTSRFKSMTTNNTAPMEKTIEVLGSPPFTLEQGIEETIEWMAKYHPDLVKVN